jgi:putative ABC transport system permease protein
MAVAGVAFAVILVLMQWGFLHSVEITATSIYSALDFDILIRSKEYLHLIDARSFPRQRLWAAESVHGVASATPLYIEQNQWRNPHQRLEIAPLSEARSAASPDLPARAQGDLAAGTNRAILVLGIVPHDPALTLPEVRDQAVALLEPGTLLIDTRSRPEFGPANRRHFSAADLDRVSELGGKRVRIVGLFTLGAGFAADGAAIVSDETFGRLFTHRTLNDVSLGLVRLEEGADAAQVQRALQQALAGAADVEVISRREALHGEIDRWIGQTALGNIFSLGMFIAAVVGTAIVYQVLYADVLAHMSEFATLKAMGYRDRDLSKVILMEAVLLALMGFGPGVLVAFGLYRLTENLSGLPMAMGLDKPGYVLLLAVVMCTVSGLLTLRKLRSADPASLF